MYCTVKENWIVSRVRGDKKKKKDVFSLKVIGITKTDGIECGRIKFQNMRVSEVWLLGTSMQHSPGYDNEDRDSKKRDRETVAVSCC